MRTLYFLRHANSPVTAPSIADDERPLDKRGRQDSEAMGIYCQKAKIFPQLILCSTATRTRETLTLVQPYLNQDFTVDFDAALYLASAATMHTHIQAVSPTISSLMLIGHNPGIQALASLLAGVDECGDAQNMRMGFPTSALAEIRVDVDSWEAVEAQSGRLIRFITL